MKDKISISRIELLHPKVKQPFTSFINECENELGIVLRVVQGFRTFDEQHALFLQKPKVTNADGGYSYHNYGLAIDLLNLVGSKPNWLFDYSKLLPYSKKYNLEWGGNFKSILDKPHFQLTFGYTVQQLLEKHKNKDFIIGTNYVNI